MYKSSETSNYSSSVSKESNQLNEKISEFNSVWQGPSFDSLQKQISVVDGAINTINSQIGNLGYIADLYQDYLQNLDAYRSNYEYVQDHKNDEEYENAVIHAEKNMYKCLENMKKIIESAKQSASSCSSAKLDDVTKLEEKTFVPASAELV